jgi:hypothetical protein
MRSSIFALSFFVLFLPIPHVAQLLAADELLVEAESFAEPGGWSLDTQFIDTMGSPYLLAHGIGTPVKNASTRVKFPSAGKYHVFVRTKDWVARWDAPGKPGRFELLADDKSLGEFGNEGAQWHWQAGTPIEISDLEVTLELVDKTGFDGRCDAIYFSKADTAPPNEDKILPAWRRQLLNLPDEPTVEGGYDLVVIGGGYAGMGAALSAARMGCKVALIQNRGVLGGNGSSEVRVWAMGNIRRGRYPRIGEIIEEFCDHATKSPGAFEEFGDAQKEEIVRAEKNIDLFLHHHAYKVDTENNRIKAVYAFNVQTSEQRRFEGKFFSDCTGHATIGFLAGADWDMAEGGRMGMSNMWAWDEAEAAREFPETPWALDLEMKDFPYPRDHHGQWFWESGFDKDALGDAEGIRDWNLRAVFGAFNAMKNRDGAADHQTAFLTWVAYIGGPRESRRLLGDLILTQEDIVNKTQFKDGCVPSTWSIDLHYPKKQYAIKYPDNPFISIAEHDNRVDRSYGYPVPYRCFYSRNIENLFMAGRCVSVTHEALGTVRVMKTCGMMGEVVGRAASICVRRECLPRDVYQSYYDDLDELMKLPGKARRLTVFDKIEIPADAMQSAGPLGPYTGIDPRTLGGVVIDDQQATKHGNWTSGTGLKGYVAFGYIYSAPNTDASIEFTYKPEKTGKYEIRVAYQPHENRGTKVPVAVLVNGETKSHEINMSEPAPIDDLFASLGEYELTAGEACVVKISAVQAGGFVHADAVQFLPVE